MQRWVSQPLAVTVPRDRLSRLDLAFEGLRRDLGSLTVFVFLNDADVPADAGRAHPSFAAAFSLFAANGCWGGEGHCDFARDAVSVFDRRPQHHLRPITVNLDVTDAVRRLDDPSSLTVTLHAARLAEPQADSGVITFDALTVLAYQ